MDRSFLRLLLRFLRGTLAEALAPCLIHSVGKVSAVLFMLYYLGQGSVGAKGLGEDGWRNRLAI